MTKALIPKNTLCPFCKKHYMAIAAHIPKCSKKAFGQFVEASRAAVKDIAASKPKADSPEGRLLAGLTYALERYDCALCKTEEGRARGGCPDHGPSLTSDVRD